MITKFKIFENNLNDIDPYGEEDWSELKFKVGDKVDIDRNYYGIIAEIRPKHYAGDYEVPELYEEEEEQEYIVRYFIKKNGFELGWGIRPESKIGSILEKLVEYDLDITDVHVGDKIRHPRKGLGTIEAIYSDTYVKIRWVDGTWSEACLPNTYPMKILKDENEDDGVIKWFKGGELKENHTPKEDDIDFRDAKILILHHEDFNKLMEFFKSQDIVWCGSKGEPADSYKYDDLTLDAYYFVLYLKNNKIINNYVLISKGKPVCDYYSADDFIKNYKVRTRVISDIDPYGEEDDWEDMKEQHQDIDPYGEEQWEDRKYNWVYIEDPFANPDSTLRMLHKLIGKYIIFKIDWVNEYKEGILQDAIINRIGEILLWIDGDSYLLDERERIGVEKELSEGIKWYNKGNFEIDTKWKEPETTFRNITEEDLLKIKEGDIIKNIETGEVLWIVYPDIEHIDVTNGEYQFELGDFHELRNNYLIKENILKEQHIDIDPYGEENWGYTIETGDILKCKRNYILFGMEEFTKGKSYKVERSFVHVEHAPLLPMTGNIYMRGNKHYIYFSIDKDKITPYIYDYFEDPNEKFMIKESHNEYNKMKATYDFIKSQIKDTEWENKVYAAGGYVRDELMGEIPKDLDLMIDKENGGIEFAEWITKHLGIYREDKNPVIYPTYGTAKFNLRKIKFNGYDLSDVEVECVMPRSEKYKSGSRNPDVEFSTLKRDAERRDTTINSMFKNLTNDEILDLTGMGKDDLKRGIVRSPIDPDIIFTEDPLRMMRVIRAAVKYNWDLPLFMIRSIKKNAKQLQIISSERVQDELNKMMLTKSPDKAIKLLQITGLSKWIFPELDKLIRMKQNKFHKYDAMRHTLEVLKNTPPDIITRLAALFHDVGKGKTREIIDSEVHFYRHEELGSYMVRDIMKRLRYPKEIINAVATAVEHHMRTKEAGDEGKISDRALRKLKQDLGPHLQHTLDLINADNISHADWANMPNQVSNIRRKYIELEEKDKEAPKKSPLSGDDIMEILDIKKGPIVGKILKILGDMYLDDPNMSKEELTEVVKKAYEEFK